MTITTMAISALMFAVVFLVIALWWLSDKYEFMNIEKNATIRQLLAELKEKDKEIKGLKESWVQMVKMRADAIEIEGEPHQSA